MEENTFLSNNPSYDENYFLDNNPNFDMGAYNDQRTERAFMSNGGNAFERWWNPQIAEDTAFERENYFVDKANAFNEYMYNKNNLYNSPAEQMKRMKEAGINPLLAAAGIAGSGGSATAPSAAQGSAQMNTNSVNPIEQLATAAGGISTAIEGANTLGQILGFGEKNKAEINQINKIADKAAEDADYTFWQKRQFRRTMRLMYDTAEKNLEQLEANIKNLQGQYEVFQQQKHNIAADTNLKVAETGEKLEETKNVWYKNQEEEFKKIFREIFGVQLNDSDMSMLVQTILGGNGKAIIQGITDTFTSIAEGLRDNITNPISDKMQNAHDRFKQWLTNREQKQQFKKDGNERREQMKAYSKNAKWVFEHSARLRKKYNNNFRDYFYNEYLPSKGISSFVPK